MYLKFSGLAYMRSSYGSRVAFSWLLDSRTHIEAVVHRHTLRHTVS